MSLPEIPHLVGFMVSGSKGNVALASHLHHIAKKRKFKSIKRTSTSLLVCSRNIAAYSFISFSLPFLAASMRTRSGTVVSKKESEM